jgi:nucleoside-diphosphate-sugar epimerase
MAGRKRILITGAAGRIATMVRETLSTDHDVTGVDIRPSEAHPDDAVADMRDLDAIRPLFRGRDLVIDFANNPAGDLSWEDAYHNNILATFNSMRAAQEAGVARYIYTSSNRITEEYQQDHPYSAICRGEYDGIDAATFPRITASMPVRPNGPYGIAKAAAEAAGRYFADKHGMSVICLRLGTMGREGQARAISASSPPC